MYNGKSVDYFPSSWEFYFCTKWLVYTCLVTLILCYMFYNSECCTINIVFLLPQAHRKLSSVEDLLTLHGLSQYTSKLVGNGYDDIRFISDITDEELEEIGVTSQSERQRVSTRVDTSVCAIFSSYTC